MSIRESDSGLVLNLHRGFQRALASRRCRRDEHGEDLR